MNIKTFKMSRIAQHATRLNPGLRNHQLTFFSPRFWETVPYLAGGWISKFRHWFGFPEAPCSAARIRLYISRALT